jgi:hypothetical protein
MNSLVKKVQKRKEKPTWWLVELSKCTNMANLSSSPLGEQKTHSALLLEYTVTGDCLPFDTDDGGHLVPS